MTEQPFWRAAAAATPGHFTYRAGPQACVGPDASHQFYMGGVAMATAVDALERHFEKPLLWATIHFLNHGMLGDDVTLSVEAVSGGRSVVQAMAEMRRGTQVLHRTLAALGARDGEPDRAFVAMPAVPPPQDCPVKADDAFADATNLLAQFERRTAFEDSAAGVEHMWIRPKFAGDLDAAALALISDFFLGAHVRTRRGTSLDNTFRLINPAPHGWVLSVTQLSIIS